MKKCASCTKDLPEAALHCVFCGAKQPPAPAVQPGLAKTAFGYSANEVMDQLGRPNPAAAPTYQPPASTSPYQQRAHSPSQAPMQQPPQPMQQPSYAQKTIAVDSAPRPQFRPMPPGVVPASDPQAATVAVPTSQAPAHGPPMPQAAPVNMYSNQQPQVQLPPHMAPAAYQQPMQQPYGAGPMPGGMGINAPNPHTPPPLQPMMAGNPYLGAQGGSPLVIEPWRESLKLVMFVWGAVLLVVFAVPKATEPSMVFEWTGIGDLPGKQLLMTVLYPAIGLLAVVAAALPLQTLARGIIAGVLGLAGVAIPLAMGGTPGWHEIVGIIGLVTLIPGLLVRNEYTDSMVARVLVTVSVICFLLPYLVPEGGELKLVNLFKQVIDAPGKGKVPPLIEIVEIVLIVMSLLAWMPGPATGGAKMIAWAIIIWTTAVHQVIVMLVGADDVGALFKQPAALVEWATLASITALIGYGTATVVGKQLE